MIDDRVETTSERHMEEARQRGRAEMRDEILAMAPADVLTRNIALQLYVAQIEAMT